MTIVTGIAALYMTRVFAQYKSAVVATDTSTQYRGMIHARHVREVGGVVAVLTAIEAVDVHNRFTNRDIAIVTPRSFLAIPDMQDRDAEPSDEPDRNRPGGTPAC